MHVLLDVAGEYATTCSAIRHDRGKAAARFATRRALPLGETLPSPLDDLRDAPGGAIARGFALALNVGSAGVLRQVFTADVTYTSGWAGVELHGIDAVVEHFRCTVARFEADGVDRLAAEVVLVPTGEAAVGVAPIWGADWPLIAITTFETSDGLHANRVHTCRAEPDAARRFDYRPPAG